MVLSLGIRFLYNLLFVVGATVAMLRKEGTGVNSLILRGRIHNVDVVVRRLFRKAIWPYPFETLTYG